MTGPTQDISITGLGLLTPLGHSPWQTLRALADGRRTADRLAELEQGTTPTAIARGTASIPSSSITHDDPAPALAERAARQALDEAGLGSVDATIIASSKGAMHLLSLAESELRPGDASTIARIVTHTPHGYLSYRLRERLGLNVSLGTVNTPVAACATSLVALDLAVRAIRDGRADRVLVVAVESALTTPFVHGYKRLGVLAPTDPIDHHVCAPLNRERHGFTLCECAASVVLERGRKPGAVLVHDTAIGTEPFDILRAPDTFETLGNLVRRVTDGAPAPALVQPHATGTADNDGRELAALEVALGSSAIGTRVYASKGAIGHGMGASGLVNVVLSCLMARTRMTPPMPWLDSPIESAFSLANAGQPLADGTHLIVNAGFGGHTAAVSLVPNRK